MKGKGEEEKENVLELTGINFSYSGEPVLIDVSLSVETGDFVGLVGPNGSGKSTLLRVILGLDAPQSGKVKLFGEEKFRDWHRVGYVPQKVSFDANFPATVLEVASMGISKKYENEVPRAIAEVGLEAQKNRLINELSGGQKQRVFLARALANKPDLLLLDEPTTGIDATQQEKFCCLLQRLNEAGMTIVMVSHDLSLIAHSVKHVACLNKKMFSCGDPKQLGTSSVLRSVYGHDVHIMVHKHEVC
ncbi:MAG: metal ABC transporter ATP-binding protein [Candidatus Micrarchaeota archaeon]